MCFVKKTSNYKKKKKKINGVYDSNCHQDALNDLVVFAMFKTFSLVLYSVDDTLNILLYAPPQKPLIYLPCFGQSPCFITI